jgi:hypothetical protein
MTRTIRLTKEQATVIDRICETDDGKRWDVLRNLVGIGFNRLRVVRPELWTDDWRGEAQP